MPLRLFLVSRLCLCWPIWGSRASFFEHHDSRDPPAESITCPSQASTSSLSVWEPGQKREKNSPLSVYSPVESITCPSQASTSSLSVWEPGQKRKKWALKCFSQRGSYKVSASKPADISVTELNHQRSCLEGWEEGAQASKSSEHGYFPEGSKIICTELGST